jgi:two-component system response regulator AtoC
MSKDELGLGHRREVLVVDDDAGVRELILAYFHELGMDAAGAEDGPSAIQTLQRSKGRYGLVVTDLNLPGADGFAVLQAARQANASCYVVIVTGYASLDSAIHAVRVGAYDYLTKPFSLGQLDVILKRIADRTALESENRELSARLTGPPAFAASPAVPSVMDVRVATIEASLARLEALMHQQVRATADRP